MSRSPRIATHPPLGTLDHPSSPSEGAPTSNGSVLLTADQLAARWQVPEAQVYRLARTGTLPTVKLGRYRRWRMADVETFEQEGGTDA